VAKQKQAVKQTAMASTSLFYNTRSEPLAPFWQLGEDCPKPQNPNPASIGNFLKFRKKVRLCKASCEALFS
jgi:hypothetical protein